MEGLAKGIEKSKSVVTDAIAGVSKDMSINANAMVIRAMQLRTTPSCPSPHCWLSTCRIWPGLNLRWETGEVAAHLARDMNIQLGILAQEEGYL